MASQICSHGCSDNSEIVSQPGIASSSVDGPVARYGIPVSFRAEPFSANRRTVDPRDPWLFAISALVVTTYVRRVLDARRPHARLAVVHEFQEVSGGYGAIAQGRGRRRRGASRQASGNESATRRLASLTSSICGTWNASNRAPAKDSREKGVTR